MPIVVSTAFRPTDGAELARNPFRVFTSMLVHDDRRFFDAETQAGLEAFMAARTLFPAELLTLADRRPPGWSRDGDAERFLDLATGAFALSREPVDHDWYFHLERISSVAADIGGVPSTHINHLTPRVLDIDDLYARMRARGIAMIDEIRGHRAGRDRMCCCARHPSGRSPRSGCSGIPMGRWRPLTAGPLRRGRAAGHRPDREGTGPV